MTRTPIAASMLAASLAILGTARAAELPPNTVACRDFTKLPSGNWHTDHAEFDLGPAKDTTMVDTTIAPGSFDLGDGADLYRVLEAKCGASSTSSPKPVKR